MWHDYEVWHQWHRWTLFCIISRNLLQACSTFCYTYTVLFNAVSLQRKVSHAFQINKCRRNKYQIWSSAVWMNIPANRAENPWWRYSCIISCHVDVTCFALMELSPSSICRCVLITSNGNVITAAVYNISNICSIYKQQDTMRCLMEGDSVTSDKIFSSHKQTAAALIISVVVWQATVHCNGNVT